MRRHFGNGNNSSSSSAGASGGVRLHSLQEDVDRRERDVMNLKMEVAHLRVRCLFSIVSFFGLAYALSHSLSLSCYFCRCVSINRSD